ncbi:MAG: GNAT family N-acetyltransferase [Rubripirellula sp.]
MNHDIRIFQPTDIPGALDLCRASGWNQLAPDWQRLIEHEPTACFVISDHEKIIGTVTTTCYGTQLAWIGMMLVHEEYRRQGIAKALIKTCLEHLHSRKIRCIKLDATPTGKLVYSQLGFRDEWSFHRWQREGNDQDDHSTAVVPESDPGWNLDLDRAAFGVARGQWLNRLANHSRVTRYREGCGMVREGYLASYVGPVIASSPQTARHILDNLLASTNRTTFWDIPHPNRDAIELAHDYGFQPVRTLTRMWTGLELTRCDLNLQYAISDPGTG